MVVSRSVVCMVVLVCWCNGQQFVWWCWSVGVTVSSLYGGVGLLV